MAAVRSRKSGAWLAFLTMAAVPSSAFAQGGNTISVPDTTLPADAAGQQIFVRCEHEVEVRGFSVSLRYDASALLVTEVTTAGTSAAAAEYFSGYHQDGKMVYGVILDLTEPFTKTLGRPAGGGLADHTLLRLTVNVLAAEGQVTEIVLEDGIKVPLGGGQESPKGWNSLVDEEGNSAPLQLDSGQITVAPAAGPAPPLAQAGPDQLVPEASSVLLDASASASPLGAPLTFLWQVDPLAQDVTGADAAQLQFTAPPVTGDTELSFEVAASDGTTSSTDQVSVFVVDMDARSAGLSNGPAGLVGRIGAGDRAIVYAGSMGWDSPYEKAYWTYVKLTATGKGDESTLLGGLELYSDSNDNGQFDPEDRRLGEPSSLSADNGSVDFTFLETLQSAAPRLFFLVAEIPQPVVSAGVAGFCSAALLAALLLAGRRAFRAGVAPALRRGLSLVLVAAFGLSLSLTLGACGGGGGGDSDRQVRFSVLDPQDLTVQGVSTGVNVTVDNLPIDGPSFKV